MLIIETTICSKCTEYKQCTKETVNDKPLCWLCAFGANGGRR